MSWTSWLTLTQAPASTPLSRTMCSRSLKPRCSCRNSLLAVTSRHIRLTWSRRCTPTPRPAYFCGWFFNFERHLVHPDDVGEEAQALVRLRREDLHMPQVRDVLDRLLRLRHALTSLDEGSTQRRRGAEDEGENNENLCGSLRLCVSALSPLS